MKKNMQIHIIIRMNNYEGHMNLSQLESGESHDKLTRLIMIILI